MLNRICAPHVVHRTTAAELTKSYKQNRPHFVTLDCNLQQSITWSELRRCAIAANTPADSEFIAFVDPRLSTHPTVHPTSPGVIPNITGISLPTTPTSAIDPMVPTIPTIMVEPVPSMTPNLTQATVPVRFVDESSPLTTPQKIAHAPFPINSDVLQPLLPEQRAALNADHNLILAISKDLGDIDTTWIEGFMSQDINSQLRCPFCNTELPGTEYSQTLNVLLNSEYIQENTVPDPTPQNPNARRSLKGYQVYSNFCSQHRLEKLLLEAKAAGWPYPPDFTNLRHRVHSKKSYIDVLAMSIQTGLGPSRFYLKMLAMSERQRREQAQDIVAAG